MKKSLHQFLQGYFKSILVYFQVAQEQLAVALFYPTLFHEGNFSADPIVIVGRHVAYTQ